MGIYLGASQYYQTLVMIVKGGQVRRRSYPLITLRAHDELNKRKQVGKQTSWWDLGRGKNEKDRRDKRKEGRQGGGWRERGRERAQPNGEGSRGLTQRGCGGCVYA